MLSAAARRLFWRGLFFFFWSCLLSSPSVFRLLCFAAPLAGLAQGRGALTLLACGSARERERERGCCRKKGGEGGNCRCRGFSVMSPSRRNPSGFPPPSLGRVPAFFRRTRQPRVCDPSPSAASRALASTKAAFLRAKGRSGAAHVCLRRSAPFLRSRVSRCRPASPTMGEARVEKRESIRDARSAPACGLLDPGAARGARQLWIS